MERTKHARKLATDQNMLVYPDRDNPAEATEVSAIKVAKQLAMCCDLKNQRSLTKWLNSGGCCRRCPMHYIMCQRIAVRLCAFGPT
eukprot:5069484-Pleurochrysis_carterae.AAC.1